MLPAEFCGECGDQVRSDCLGSLAAVGVHKAHWECWSHCNLRCDFCFRTMGKPIDTDGALRLMRAIKSGGVTSLVFAGGDPTLRTDLPNLVSHARSLGLLPIVHTNMHRTTEKIWSTFAQCDHVGISIDAATSEIHDKLRGREGNFNRVLAALDRCVRDGIRVSVRTVVNAINLHAIQALGSLLEQFDCVRSWKLLEFSAIEQGWSNRKLFEISPAQFNAALLCARRGYAAAPVEALRTSDKIDAYMMISPDGHVYGVTEKSSIKLGKHQYVGQLLGEHLSAISDRLLIDPHRHAQHLKFEQHV